MGKDHDRKLVFAKSSSVTGSFTRRSVPGATHVGPGSTFDGNEGNLPDEVIKFLTTPDGVQYEMEDEVQEEKKESTAAATATTICKGAARSSAGSVTTTSAAKVEKKEKVKNEASKRGSGAGEMESDAPSPPSISETRLSRDTPLHLVRTTTPVGAVAMDGSDVVEREPQEEKAGGDDEHHLDTGNSNSHSRVVMSERLSAGVPMPDHRLTPPVPGYTATSPEEMTADNSMATTTTTTTSFPPITAQLVESDSDDDKEAPWKEEVDRLRRELEALKQNQSQIVLAEPVSAAEVQAAQDAHVSPLQVTTPPEEEQHNKRRYTVSEIHGRESEVEQLKKSLQEVDAATATSTAAAVKKQLVLISGESGVGKSVLAQEIKGKEDCHFLSGKYDPQKQEQPYSAIGDACNQVIQDLLTYKGMPALSPYPYKEFRSKIHQLMDESDTDLLQTVIPTLNRLVGESATTHDINYTEVKHRFHHAFKRFVKLLCSFPSPLVMALDDLQWIDQSSLEILTGLLTDTDVPPFVLIASYRDKEVNENHPFIKAVEEWKTNHSDELNVSDIQLKNLSEEQVLSLLLDMLSTSQEGALAALAQCVHTKTAGNPFYVKQFVLSLLSRGMLSCCDETQQWQYDATQLNDMALATDNVVELLTNKIHQLPPAVQTLLPRIASLGSRFDKKIVQIVIGDQDEDILGCCIREGLIVECGGQGWYRWEHDKIMEATLLLVQEGKLNALKSELGWLIFDALPREEVPGHLFAITNLLNAGSKQENQPRGAELVQLNFRSGKTALEASAFQSAGRFLKNGIELLPDDKWKSQFELALEMYSTAAEAHYCAGEFQQALEYCDEVLALTGCDLVSKQRVYNVRMDAFAAQGKVSETIALLKQILKKLGCKFPRVGRGLSAISGVMRTAMSVDKTTKKLDCLLPVKDKEKKWAIYLLNRMAHWTYLCEPSLTPLAIVKGLDWTVKYGRTDTTSPTLGTIALILAGSVGDFAGGKRYADLAIKYMDTSVASKTLFLCYQFVYHYQIPTKECLPHLEKSYDTGMKTGDVESAFWASYCVLEAQLHTGSPVPQLLEDCALFSRRTASHNQEMIGWSVQPCRQLVANLMNKDSNRHILTGDYMDEDMFKKKIEEHAHYHHQLSRYKICAAFWFNEYEVVVQFMEEFGYHNFSIEKATPGTNGIGSLYFQCAMSCVALAHQNKKKHALQKKRAKKFLAKLKEWVNKGNPNVQHYESLLEAELASLSGNPSIIAAKHYEYAILLAEKQELLNDQGIAHERYGDHCARNGDKEGARRHYESAIELYKKWGALAKVEMVQSIMGQE